MALTVVLTTIVIVVAAGLSLALARRRAHRGAGAAAAAPPGPARADRGRGRRRAARSLAAELMREERYYEGLSILEDPRVAEVVAALARTSVPRLGDLGSRALPCQHLRADPRPRRAAPARGRAVGPTTWAFSALKRCPPPLEPLFYALLLARGDGPVIARALALCADVDPDELARFIAARREQEEIGAQTSPPFLAASCRRSSDFVDEQADILGSDLPRASTGLAGHGRRQPSSSAASASSGSALRPARDAARRRPRRARRADAGGAASTSRRARC